MRRSASSSVIGGASSAAAAEPGSSRRRSAAAGVVGAGDESAGHAERARARALHHVEPGLQVELVFGQVRTRLGERGIFSGYTIAQEPGIDALCFSGPEQLRAYMARFFAHVTVFETRSHERQNLYFWASQSTVPLRPDWPQVAIS